MAQIVQITASHPRTDARIFLKECRGLAQLGYPVTLLVADGQGTEVLDGVRIESVRKARGRLSRMVLGPFRLFRKAVRLRAAVYHLHDPELIPMGLALKLSGAKVVFDSHEDLPKQILAKSYIPAPLRAFAAGLAYAFQRAALPWFDGVVAATPPIRAFLLPMNKNTVNINNFPILGELAQATPRQPTGQSICYIGLLSQTRGILELVDAMALLPEGVDLLLAGPVESASFFASLQTREGWVRTRYLGNLGREGVRDTLARSLVGMVTLHPTPNHLEAFAIKMFEYMSAGLPVIASDFPLWRSIIGEASCGLCVDPLDPRAIADAIADLLARPEQARTMGRNGQQAVLDRYNWQSEAVKLGDFYHSLLNP